MTVNVSVAGYGNLGKQLVQQIQTDKRFCLKYVFSRRKLDLPNRKSFEQADLLAEQTDVLLLALGSYEDIEQHLRCFAKYNTVDCFDNHGKMQQYKQLLQSVKPQKFSLYGAGWDPGILSLSRGLFGAIGRTATVWGKGQSMGHGNAVRSIHGVLDAVQFTCPVDNAEKIFLDGENFRHLVKRVCYVAAVKSDQADVERQIRTMPDYFDGYQTEVYFVEKSEVAKLRQDMSHCGKVLGCGDGWQASTTVSMQNNSAFTAQIMLQCAAGAVNCIKDGYKGAFSLFDIPLRYFACENCL